MSWPADIVEGAKLGGHFVIGDDRVVLGELTIKGSLTSLYLHDSQFFDIDGDEVAGLHGTLHERTKVTALNCGLSASLGSAHHHGERYHFAELTPAYVVTGNRHLSIDTPTISRIMFHIDDAERIFYDFDALGHVLDPEAFIGLLVEANERKINRKIPTGPSPEIIYFAGRTELADVDTAIGRIRICHRPVASSPLSSPRNAGITNHIIIEVVFSEALLLDQALDRMVTLRDFFGVLAGRPQNIDGLRLGTVGDDPSWLDLYWARPPRRLTEWEQGRPHPIEILVSVVDEPGEFADVLTRWLTVNSKRREARMRFTNSFEEQRHFSIDRIIGAANMFDILPTDAFPPPEPLPQETATAKQLARAAFRTLPHSPDRDSILSALGRLGGATLRRKVLHRAEMVSGALKEPLAHLEAVVDEAVKCRNYYVHGSPGSFSYAENGELTTFLACALEFIFAASDLLDAGWNIQRWRSRGSVGSHPFNQVLLGWDHHAAWISALREPTSDAEASA